jgi:hypothetical protein
MQRNHSWPEDLHMFIEARKSEPFSWGINDCCTFTADAILAMTGVDTAAEYRGKTYTTEAAAFAELHAICAGATVEDAAVYAANKYGMTALPSVLFAQRGDLVLLSGPDGLALGIVYLNGKEALFVAPDGLHRIPVKTCTRAWRV